MDSVTDSWQHLLPILKIPPLREMIERECHPTPPRPLILTML